MVEALKTKGVPVAYVPLKKSNMAFASPKISNAVSNWNFILFRIFGFIPADPIEPIQIQNLDD